MRNLVHPSLTLLFLFSFSFPALSVEPNIKPGDTLERELIVGHGKLRIPLPEGTWEVAVIDKKLIDKNRSRSGVTYYEAFLFKADRKRLTQLIYLSTTLTSGHGRGFVLSNYCRRSEMHLLKTDTVSIGGLQDCRWVNHSRIRYVDSHYELKNQFGKYLDKKGITYPNHFIDAGYRFADKFHALTILYHFSPETDGHPNYPTTKWNDSPWHKNQVSGDVGRMAFINKIKQWSDQWYPKVKQGFVPNYD